MEKDRKVDHITKDKFEFVQRDEKIYDKRLETKPIGYFQDAFIRFSKNRTNLIATFILVTLILLSIFVPMLTSKNYTRIDVQLQYLPPRVPILERFGIADGTRVYSDQPVDLSTIDPETGLGLPVGFNPDYIKMSTLDNYSVFCTNVVENCVGGQVRLTIARLASSVQMNSRTSVSFSPGNNPKIVVDVFSINGSNPELNVILTPSSGDPVIIGTITEAGVHEFNVFDSELSSFLLSRISLELTANAGSGNVVSLNSVKVFNDGNEEPVYQASGFDLARFQLEDTNAGSVGRSRGEILMATFNFDSYGAAFGEFIDEAFSSEDYYRLIGEYGDLCVIDEYIGDGWTFEEGCPIKQVISKSEELQGPDGNFFYSYHVVIDYLAYAGYDEIPYFFFGTNPGGRDYFAMVWLGLRTSLLIGLVVAMINISIGIVYGSIEGYYGGMVDLLMERFGEIVGRIPFLVWLALFVIIMGPGVLTLIVLMTVTGWLGVAGTTRTQFYRYKGREYVLASRTLGAKDSRIIFRHILPNGIGTIITASILMIPGVIFAESTISYLGYGIGHGQSFRLFGFIQLSGISIGVLLADGRATLTTRPYLTFFPALIISILMITFNMFGNALRDAFNPSLRGSE
ncbi:ABC transporter permease [Liberiplasma polymorphum]|uniref:ABC transporter permease n=1 Tax=Liberiplasma polymorphum TaxID=3374570 RepID=UPI0037721349